MATTVYKKNVPGPATHALVIGVGHYAHLAGGAGKKKYPNNEGLGQLKSPPVSAQMMARWLIENYQSQQRPLATVSLLVSEKSPTPFEYHANGKKKAIKPQTATMANVEQAMLDWHAFGNTNPDNLLLFYFCGHGIAAGSELALLMEDFGANAIAPLNGALDFRGFYRGMEECAAREQCYFLDACRVGSKLLEKNNGAGTRTPIQWTGNVDNPGGRLRLGPTFHSTLPDQPAYAQPGKPSVFTQALLESLAGAASGNELGPWEVRTTRLQDALDFLMLQASRDLRMPQAQIPSTDNTTKVVMNTLQTPAVPVVVRVDPEAALPLATLRCENATRKERRTPSAEPWRLSLVPASYSFFADIDTPDFKSASLLNDPVQPPYWSKPLRVKP